MSKIKITLPDGEHVCNGKQITFRLPFGCGDELVTSLVIEGVTYTLRDPSGYPLDVLSDYYRALMNGGMSLGEGPELTVILDTARHSAYINTPSFFPVDVAFYTKTAPITLWENPKPTDDFEGRDITIDGNLSLYRRWHVFFYVESPYPYTIEVVCTQRGMIYTAIGTAIAEGGSSMSNAIFYRTFRLDEWRDDTVTFSSCERPSSSSETPNHRLVPYKIVGYKF